MYYVAHGVALGLVRKIPMRFRKLRIAWSVVWGLAGVLLIVLWVRSHYICDAINLRYRESHYAWIVAVRGGIILELTEIRNSRGFSGFAIDHLEATQMKFPAFADVHWVRVLRLGNLTEVYAPIWLPILFVAMIAAVPWLGWSNRFTLRTLLIATTLVAVVLGLIVWPSR
jgi:hypothetical protein